MGERKRVVANSRKETNKSFFIAKLTNCPTSPRKMRLVADLIRGQQVDKALQVLKFTRKEAAIRLEKLLRSAIANWEQKTSKKADELAGIYVKAINVDSGRQLKRLRPAPQGRGYRIRKRSNHVTLILSSKAGFNNSSPAIESTSTEENAVKTKAETK